MPAVKYLTENGYHVVGTGETDHRVFSGIKGYYSFENLKISYDMINLFSLMSCFLFIGQNSGPFFLSTSCTIPCLLTDTAPHCEGPVEADDIILYKTLCLNGKPLSLVEIYRKHEDLAFWRYQGNDGLTLESNTETEILEAVKETIARINGTLVMSEEDELLCEKFRELPSKEMPLSYTGNRTSLHILRQIKEELLAVPPK
ncbi:TIGR04372 family glycosyltransferase [Candidatus Magnetomonas plexicatena]|uniref:TIGR04372 family glycosyltransferase n=1 Tax=Candidatus Magnetomonas plexicatena TaxID=2552947 RepID=UPI001C754727|nr:TIGR04372 family glycosyltransferase [Nitrospirales bacterium LBB_01]